jgi:hypothetical protein
MPTMICEGCGGGVQTTFCPSCGRRMRPTDVIPDTYPGATHRVVYRRHMSARRLWSLRVSALFLLLAGLVLVVAAVRA